MNTSTRRTAYSLARTFLYKKNVTLEELIFARDQLPKNGYRAEGMRTQLNRRIQAIEEGTAWFGPWK